MVRVVHDDDDVICMDNSPEKKVLDSSFNSDDSGLDDSVIELSDPLNKTIVIDDEAFEALQQTIEKEERAEEIDIKEKYNLKKCYVSVYNCPLIVEDEEEGGHIKSKNACTKINARTQ